MRLIDADKLHYHKVWIEKDQKFAVVVFAKEIDHAPTIDAEPVVRCNDCKHFEEGKLKCRFHSTETQEIQMFPTWFCSEGERKGGDE